METLKGLWATYLGIIEIPLRMFAGPEGVAPGVRTVYDIVATFIVLSIVYSVFRALRAALRWTLKGDSLLERSDMDAVVSKDPATLHALTSSRNLKAHVKPLIKSRQYGEAAEVYAQANRPAEAAKWYAKAKQRRKAAEHYAKAGETVKAAKLLMKEGDFATAGEFYKEKGKHLKAAKAFEKAGDLPQAAAEFALGGKVAEGAKRFGAYFDEARDSAEEQFEAAKHCYEMLKDPSVTKTLGDEQRQKLTAAVAQRFEYAKQYLEAAEMYKSIGELGRAGETYVLAGRLQEAAECFKAAGKTKEANRVGGRFYELKGRFREAGMAYQAGEEYKRAGECFVKAGESVRAAECFERAGENYRAGLGYGKASRFEDAIRVLQKVKEDHPQYNQARGLLGRCFYELHDYAHCAATLDNHLTGKRVESGNAEYFYMLALALEQLGRLDESRELLYKLRSVDVNYRDVNDRISNISSRISMRESGTLQPGAVQEPHAARPQNSQKMELVENSIGKRYVLEKELGRGGMGEVYLAKDTQLDRAVAIKFLGSLIDNSQDYRDRFLREAKAAARITHPNIVAIYDVNASEGKTFIAMEYVEGTNLHGYVDHKGKLTPREAVNIIGQACSALQAIHDAGIVHRDLKPDNILLSKGGVAKLTDFGLAKAEDHRLTRAGTILGTPSYMAPEQVRGEDVGPTADIYAIGLVLHEALTGETVFEDGDVLERQVHENPPPPSMKNDAVSSELDAVVLKCLAKDPAERYQSAKELVQALRSLPQPQGQSQAAPTQERQAN